MTCALKTHRWGHVIMWTLSATFAVEVPLEANSFEPNLESSATTTLVKG